MCIRDRVVDVSGAIVGEGRYWHWWWNDLIVYDLRWQSSLQTVEAQTKDKIHLSVKITVTARPVRIIAGRSDGSRGHAGCSFRRIRSRADVAGI